VRTFFPSSGGAEGWLNKGWNTRRSADNSVATAALSQLMHQQQCRLGEAVPAAEDTLNFINKLSEIGMIDFDS
jgi:hypothetical protein